MRTRKSLLILGLLGVAAVATYPPWSVQGFASQGIYDPARIEFGLVTQPPTEIMVLGTRVVTAPAKVAWGTAGLMLLAWWTSIIIAALLLPSRFSFKVRKPVVEWYRRVRRKKRAPTSVGGRYQQGGQVPQIIVTLIDENEVVTPEAAEHAIPEHSLSELSLQELAALDFDSHVHAMEEVNKWRRREGPVHFPYTSSDHVPADEVLAAAEAMISDAGENGAMSPTDHLRAFIRGEVDSIEPKKDTADLADDSQPQLVASGEAGRTSNNPSSDAYARFLAALRGEAPDPAAESRSAEPAPFSTSALTGGKTAVLKSIRVSLLEAFREHRLWFGIIGALSAFLSVLMVEVQPNVRLLEFFVSVGVIPLGLTATVVFVSKILGRHLTGRRAMQILSVAWLAAVVLYWTM